MAKPTMIDESDALVIKFWSCPVKFVPGSVWAFLDCRYFYEKHPSSPFPSIGDVSPRYLQAESIFDYELSQSIMEGN